VSSATLCLAQFTHAKKKRRQRFAYLVSCAEETLAESVTHEEAFQDDERSTVSLGAQEHRSHRY
jgi:hypothetical protein